MLQKDFLSPVADRPFKNELANSVLISPQVFSSERLLKANLEISKQAQKIEQLEELERLHKVQVLFLFASFAVGWIVYECRQIIVYEHKYFHRQIGPGLD